MLSKIAKFARTPQGRRLLDKAVTYARSPQGRDRLGAMGKRVLAERERRRGGRRP